MAPPTPQTVERLTAADGGYEHSAVLQALLNAGGDESAALANLRSTRVQGVGAEPTAESAAAMPTTVAVVATLAPQSAQPAGAGSKTLSDRLSELNEARDKKLVSEQEYQVISGVGMRCLEI